MTKSAAFAGPHQGHAKKTTGTVLIQAVFHMQSALSQKIALETPDFSLNKFPPLESFPTKGLRRSARRSWPTPHRPAEQTAKAQLAGVAGVSLYATVDAPYPATCTSTMA